MQFALKFQQLTGPIMAKGVEDTAFYVYNRLASLNEVGGNPQRFGLSVQKFHERSSARHHGWPHSLLSTSTHDCKRGEDVRARINVLSEIPDEWRKAVNRWARWNARKKAFMGKESVPSRNDEYLLYQTLIGAWPEPPEPGSPATGGGFDQFRERIVAYMLKASREAKIHTSWINPNAEYESALEGFVRRILRGDTPNRFLDDLRVFQARVAWFGRLNSLSQVILKLTAPGVPDLYQGSELWELSLVDPDNRRPVDSHIRRSMLREIRASIAQTFGSPTCTLLAIASELLDSAHDGRIKLFLTHSALRFRRARRELFTLGDYRPIQASGSAQAHACAFARTFAGDMVVAVVPILVARLTGSSMQLPVGEPVWTDTSLDLSHVAPVGRFRNALTGETVLVEDTASPRLPLARLFQDFPYALLEPA